ncbi:hypothetical protein D3C72_1424960 [compost metagenome]
MAALINKRIRAGSLVEVVVALVIIMTVFALSLMIYIKIMGASFSGRKLWANSKLKEVANQVKKEHRFKDDTINEDELIIDITVKPYPQSSDLILLELEAKDLNGIRLNEYKEIVLKDENQ